MRVSKVLTFCFGLALLGSGYFLGQNDALLSPAEAAAAPAKTKVVYHISDAKGQALAGLRNISNHLDTAPDTEIVVVAHADGIDFLMTDYEDAMNVEPLISTLESRGVKFEVCEITLKRRNIGKDEFMLFMEEDNFVPSGVVRIAELQSKQGFAYLKP